MKTITRIQTGVRLESRLLKVLKALATELDMSLGDLLDKGMLARWYRPERLANERARRIFLLPEPVR